jgi:hypothetical protein
VANFTGVKARKISAALFVAVSLLAGCRRASVADEGAAAQASAFPTAVMQASDRAYRASPQAIAPEAKGTAIREPAARNSTPTPVSSTQR